MTQTNAFPADGRATRTKKMFSMEYSVTTNIQASPAEIWAILTNAPGYTDWNSTVERIEGRIASGEKIRLIAKISPDRTFSLRVTAFSPEQKMIWKSGTPPMFGGVRTYTLMPKGEVFTEFTMTEVFSGLMLPVIAGSLPDFRAPFEQFAADLKRYAERTSAKKSTDR